MKLKIEHYKPFRPFLPLKLRIKKTLYFLALQANEELAYQNKEDDFYYQRRLDEEGGDFLADAVGKKNQDESGADNQHVEPTNTDEGGQIVQIHVGKHFEIDAFGCHHCVGTKQHQHSNHKSKGKKPSDEIDEALWKMPARTADKRTAIDFPGHGKSIE